MRSGGFPSRSAHSAQPSCTAFVPERNHLIFMMKTALSTENGYVHQSSSSLKRVFKNRKRTDVQKLRIAAEPGFGAFMRTRLRQALKDSRRLPENDAIAVKLCGQVLWPL